MKLSSSTAFNHLVLIALTTLVCSLPWAPPVIQDLMERATAIQSISGLSLINLTTSVKPPVYPPECFKAGIFTLETTVAADCEIIIDQIILHMENPMREQTFGFDETADVDLSLEEFHQWHHGQCIISIDSTFEEEQDIFRPVDVAEAAQRIIRQCVTGTKEAYGGHVHIGSAKKNFYVIVGGVEPLPTPAVSAARLSLSSRTPTEPSDDFDANVDAKDSKLRTRSGNATELAGNYNLPLVCIKPGMPSAGDIDLKDCLLAADSLLSLSNILISQVFTTEATGGVHVPDIHHNDSCYLTVNTNSALSKTESFSYVKVAYYASEIMRRCSLGGVAKLTAGENGFYVSLTGTNPVSLESEIGELLGSTAFDLTVGGIATLRLANLNSS